MRTALFQFSLALVLLARGPLCGLLCEFAAFDPQAPAAVHHGAAGQSPCHAGASALATEPTDPAEGHDCAGCDDRLLTAGTGTATATAGVIHTPSLTGFWPSSRAATRERVVRAPPTARPLPPDILLLNTTLLI